MASTVDEVGFGPCKTVGCTNHLTATDFIVGNICTPCHEILVKELEHKSEAVAYSYRPKQPDEAKDGDEDYLSEEFENTYFLGITP